MTHDDWNPMGSPKDQDLEPGEGPSRRTSRPRVAVASLGGTITMTATDSGAGGVAPSLTAQELLDSVPHLAEEADLVTTTLRTMPGASLTGADVLDALHWARAEVASGACGAVLIQGTDTIEETAYLLDLYWPEQAPVVVTGAMRAPQLAGADGPANLLASVQVAGAAAARGRGVLVVLNDEIHAASRVRKMRASGPAAFASPSFGPIGFVQEGTCVFGHAPCPDDRGGQDRASTALMPPPERPVPRVALLEATLGDDGELLALVTAAGFDGAVVAGFGVGHVSAGYAESIERALASMPVVLASRTGSGATFRHSYGFTGSESDLLARGAIPAGWLDPRKARILLTALLASGADRAMIRRELETRGRGGAQ